MLKYLVRPLRVIINKKYHNLKTHSFGKSFLAILAGAYQLLVVTDCGGIRMEELFA